MPYIVPNAIDIGARFASLDQAEPDALDFQILGERSSGVLGNGCEVTHVPATTSVYVSQGFVALRGVVYPLNKGGAKIVQRAVFSLPTILSNNKRFDLVVGRLSTIDGAPSMEVIVLVGPESENNPTFPISRNRAEPLPPIPTHYFDPETDVVLAAVYRVGGNFLTQANIVDKRVNVLSTTMIRGVAVPDNSFGGDGDFYYRLQTSANASGLYIKKEGVWIELILESDFRAANPIGTIIMWPSSTPPNSLYWRECNGQSLLRSEFPELFSLLGSTYGPVTTTQFIVPDLRNKFVRGSDVAGATGGDDTVSLSVSNLPSHTHSISDHSHSIGSHTHSINVQNQNVLTSEAGDHSHFGDSSGNEVVVRLTTNQLGNYVAPYSSRVIGYADGMHYNYGGSGNQAPGGNTTNQGGITVAARTSTNVAGRHTHTVLTNFTGVVDPSTAGETGTSIQPNTGSTGSGSSFSNIPAYMNMRWFIKVK